MSNQSKYDVIWREGEMEGICSGKAFVSFFFDGFSGEMRAGQTIIHFGCRTAHVTKDFLEKGLNVTLVDISPYSVDEEIRKLLTLYSNQVHFVQACLWKLPASLKSSYWIYCCDVLEYLPEGVIDTVLEQMAKRVRFGGYFSIRLKDFMERKNSSSVQTLKEKSWWEKRLQKQFVILGEDVIADEGYFNCRVKPRL